jgi:hypothetical protein
LHGFVGEAAAVADVTSRVPISVLRWSLLKPKLAPLSPRNGEVKEMGNDPKQGEDFVKVPMPRESDDVEGHKQGLNPKPGEGFVKVPMPRDTGEDFVKVPMPRESDDDTEGHRV